jgi:hypothetical protein
MFLCSFSYTFDFLEMSILWKIFSCFLYWIYCCIFVRSVFLSFVAFGSVEACFWALCCRGVLSLSDLAGILLPCFDCFPLVTQQYMLRYPRVVNMNYESLCGALLDWDILQINLVELSCSKTRPCSHPLLNVSAIFLSFTSLIFLIIEFLH